MNNGSKIIVILSILAGVFFLASYSASCLTHREIRDFNAEKFAQLEKHVSECPQKTLLAERLKNDGYTVTEVSVSSWIVRWNSEDAGKRLQETHLDVPSSAEITFSADGRCIVTGRKE